MNEGSPTTAHKAESKLAIVSPLDPSQPLPDGAHSQDQKPRMTWFATTLILLMLNMAAWAAWGYFRVHPAKIETSVPAKAPTKEVAKQTIDPIADIQLGTRQFKEKDYDGALRTFLKALNEKPNDPTLLVDVGMTYKAKKDIKNARKFYEAAIKLKPDFAPAYNNLAMVSVEEKDWKSAISFLEKAISADPKQVSFVLNLAKVYEKTGKWSLADRAYSQYIASPAADSLIKNLLEKRLKTIRLLANSDANRGR
jgi:tetratricopeptide (TPR) repeat protein